MTKLVGSDQFIHCELENLKDELKEWCTTIYGLNTLDQRKRMWKHIENLQVNAPGS